MKQKQVHQQYIRDMLIALIAYFVVLVVSISILQQDWIQFREFIILISLTPVFPVVLVILAVMRALRDSDELQQRVQLMATSFSAAMTGLITFSYGFLENVGFPKFPTIFVFPMLIAIWGISLGYFSRKY
ncbi:MAG TPA: hypothetical protein VJ972_09280 [Anaerolineales bacterium]|nr:hypothetical protein [Anaerolineales bacterium]